MPQKHIEFILFRQLAYYLASPIFLVDVEGNLIFCNESAERVLGFRFSQTGEMSASEWSTIFTPQDQHGNLIAKEKLPLYITNTHHRIAYDKFYIRNIQNEIKHVELFAFPMINQMGIFLGTIAFFQEIAV